jgi:hypothetical protein
MVGEALLNNLNTYANLIATYDNNMCFLPVAASALYRPRTTLISLLNVTRMRWKLTPPTPLLALRREKTGRRKDCASSVVNTDISPGIALSCCQLLGPT